MDRSLMEDKMLGARVSLSTSEDEEWTRRDRSNESTVTRD